MSTTIYLDVDGVLNAVSKKRPSLKLSGWGLWGTKQVNGWPIQYSPDMIDALNELADRDDVTFKWLTTWTHDAAYVLSPAIGIHGQDWEVLDGDQHAWGGKRGWWKLEAIRRDVGARAPERFVWIDDDLKAESAALDWFETLEGRVLPISPSVTLGLTWGDLMLVRNFVTSDAEVAA